MKAVWFFKFLVFLFSFLLLIGFTFIAYKIAEQKKDGKLKTTSVVVQADFSDKINAAPVLKKEDEIAFAFNCSEDVCLTVKSPFDGYRLIVIDPQQGIVKNNMSLSAVE